MNSHSATLPEMPSPVRLLGKAALIQLSALVVATTLSWWQGWSVGAALILTAALALLMTWQSDLPRWWLVIQAVFMPSAAAVLSSQIPAWIFLGVLVGLLFVYGDVFFSRVPLYLSGKPAFEALERLMPAEKNFYFLDLGCGTGSVLRYLDARFPFGMFHGVETAPLPFALSWLSSHLGGAQFRVRLQSIWQTDLSRYDLVYAFLSPQAMPDLWQKVSKEMKPGSLFISNSFEVPGVEPDQVIQLDNGLANRLYLWHIPEQGEGSP